MQQGFPPPSNEFGGECTWKLDAEITFDGTWKADNNVTGLSDYKKNANDEYVDYQATIPTIDQNWHLTAQFLDANQANTATMFSLLSNPTNSAATWRNPVNDATYWGDNSVAQTHPTINQVTTTTNAGGYMYPGGGAANTVTRIYHGAGQTAQGSSLMRFWYMADPAHHIDLDNYNGANPPNPFYGNGGFDDPLVDVVTKTVKIEIPAGSTGAYVVFIPEKSAGGLYDPAAIITRTIGPNTLEAQRTFTLTANVGAFINKAVWHYSGANGGFDHITHAPAAVGAGPVACSTFNCHDDVMNGPFDCTFSMHSGNVGGLGAVFEPSLNYVGIDPGQGQTNGYYADNLDRYYGRFGHTAWQQEQSSVLPGASCTMPGVDPGITQNNASRGDILAVICLDDHVRLKQISEMGLGDNIQAI
tara:strand:- start:7305 stop:8552 length:1248 start_codon:yes stop_codon:yes gene_type:complete